MVFPAGFFFLFAAALALSAVGFKNYIWFISLGYGFAIAGEGLLMLILHAKGLTLGTAILCLLLVAYGCRLSGYLAFREFVLTSYKERMKGEIKEGKTVPFFVKIAIWVTCALLYVTQVLPVFYRLQNGAGSNLFTWIGAGVMAFGLLMETAADLQKNRAKKINPRRFVDTGLYRLVRCPNYLGEMLFWTGCLISGVGTVSGWQWAMVLVGYIGIIYVMFSGARRLEMRQDRNYGADPEYQKYVKMVPIMIPFVPLYSVKKHKWLVA